MITTRGCRIDSEIQFGGTAYELAGSIMHRPGHFWAIVWYKNQVWHYGDGGDGDVYIRTLAPGQSYVTAGDQKSSPNVILYIRKDSRVNDSAADIEKMVTDEAAKDVDVAESKGTEMDLVEE